MKNLRKLLTICMVIAMLGAVLVLASCSLFSSDVENFVNELAEADSYTMEYDDTIMKVDFDNLMTCTIYLDDDGKEEGAEYCWYDEDADKYYCAEVEGDDIYKEEISKADFISEMSSASATSATAIVKILDLLDENDGTYSYTRESGTGDYKVKRVVSYYVNDDDQLCMEYKTVVGGETEKEVSKIYDIDDTVIEIPEDVLKADAEELED